MRTDLKQSSIRSLVTANMIIATRTPQTVGKVIGQRHKTSYGDVEIAVPRDRNSEFEPQIVKRQHYMSLTILQRNGFQNTSKSAYHGEITGLNYQHISSIRNLSEH